MRSEAVTYHTPSVVLSSRRSPPRLPRTQVKFYAFFAMIGNIPLVPLTKMLNKTLGNDQQVRGAPILPPPLPLPLSHNASTCAVSARRHGARCFRSAGS